MSKNVAVFVDVANIFYAAKAAGVDIDYVTLLKSATANRDFVRAYAYTGLDPENENQRQFHSFLARSGYKVISKDIRKYGDGRIKANLDIELVVDLMKTARNLDIAVVVSGDGDFAPAIRAVQEMGVRCEVISFRGNTSSDLIEVADQFTDIAQIARVEKGSVRSGRRVASEGDLSMTEVPEKETEGAPRRRRGGRTTREERVEEPVVVEALPGNLVVLPGERLSRAPEDGEDAEELTGDVAAVASSANGSEPAQDGDVIGEDGRRRRRRRGGRGRGRGRQPGEGAPIGDEPVAAQSGEEDEEFEDVATPTQLPHHTFGSVWDSQLGVPSSALPSSPMTTSLGGEDEDDLDEPEVPEYLLAERRQRGQSQGRGGVRSPRGRSAYQAALDRERYGRSAPPQPSYGSGGGGGGNRPDRSRDRNRGGRPQPSRPSNRPPRVEDRPMPSEARSSSEPWSEVPPELEQMLRAEMARKQPAGSGAAPSSESFTPSSEAPSFEAPVLSTGFEEVAVSDFGATAGDFGATAGGFGSTATDEPAAAAKPARKPRVTKATSTRATASTAETESPDAADADAAAAKPARKPRTTKATTTKATATKAKVSASEAKEPAAAESAAAEEAATAEEAPKKTVRRRKTTASSTEES